MKSLLTLFALGMLRVFYAQEYAVKDINPLLSIGVNAVIRQNDT